MTTIDKLKEYLANQIKLRAVNESRVRAEVIKELSQKELGEVDSEAEKR